MVTLQRKVTQVVGTSSGALQRRSFGFASREDELKSLALRLEHHQGVLASLDFLRKAVMGESTVEYFDAPEVGQEIRRAYNIINDAELNSPSRVKGYSELKRTRDRFVDWIYEMIRDIDEEITGSVFTPVRELMNIIQRLITEIKRELRVVFDVSSEQYDEFIRLNRAEGAPLSMTRAEFEEQERSEL